MIDKWLYQVLLTYVGLFLEDTWGGMLGWRKWRFGGSCSISPDEPHSFHANEVPREAAFPSKETIHQDFLGCSTSSWKTGKEKGTEHTQDRTSMKQDLLKVPGPTEVALCPTELPVLHPSSSLPLPLAFFLFFHFPFFLKVLLALKFWHYRYN